MKLSPTGLNDIAWVMSLEASKEATPFIDRWPEHAHLAALQDELVHHLLLLDDFTRRLGLVILVRDREHVGVIELKRIVIMSKGKGIGKAAFPLLLDYATEKLRATRIWLDVHKHNHRAHHLYTSFGFREFSARSMPRSHHLIFMEKLLGSRCFDNILARRCK